MNMKDHDRADYFLFLEQYHIAPETARRISEITDDLIPFPAGDWPVALSASRIEGRGLFATRDIHPGAVIAPARMGDKRTPAGRYTNHAVRPNARFALSSEGDFLLEAMRPILTGEEITVDYRQAVQTVQLSVLTAVQRGKAGR